MKTRKELKDEYKQKKQRIGVYQVRNLQTNRILIGSSINLDKIWNRIQFDLEMGSHKSADLQQDWKALGKENFAFEVISEIEESDNPAVNSRDELKELEDLTMKELGSKGLLEGRYVMAD